MTSAWGSADVSPQLHIPTLSQLQQQHALMQQPQQPQQQQPQPQQDQSWDSSWWESSWNDTSSNWHWDLQEGWHQAPPRLDPPPAVAPPAASEPASKGIGKGTAPGTGKGSSAPSPGSAPPSPAPPPQEPDPLFVRLEEEKATKLLDANNWMRNIIRAFSPMEDFFHVRDLLRAQPLRGVACVRLLWSPYTDGQPPFHSGGISSGIQPSSP